MKSKFWIYPIILLGFGLVLTNSCKKEEKPDESAIVHKETLNGYAQKGPYLNGASVTIIEMDENLNLTGKLFNTQITDNSGSFTLSNVDFASQYISLKVDGYYFNEVSGILEPSPLTLYGICDISDKSSININILTYLEKDRIETLLKKNIPFALAKDSAQKELLKVFRIKKTDMRNSETLDISKSGEDNAILLAVSAILQGNRSVAELSEFLANFINDFKSDGVITNENIGAALLSSAQNLDLAKVRQNVDNRFTELEIVHEISDFETYVDIFFNPTPTVSSIPITEIAGTTATGGGNISSQGEDEVTQKGVCWSSTNSDPSLSDSKTTDGSGAGIFSSIITGLSESTLYYVRAYATNSVGTGYGDVITFTTPPYLPVVETSSISVETTSATCGGNVISDGEATIIARGVCWSTTTNPTIANSRTEDGTGIGIFISSITGLTSNTPYYIRAYATNSFGTAYGAELIINIVGLPILTTSILTGITAVTATSGGNISFDGGATVTARGICWSNSPGPTITDNKTINGTGTGSFISSISELTPETSYYLRAYATNIAGTAYGDEITFTTLKEGFGNVTDIDGNIYDTITIGTQTWMTENLKTTKYNDGAEIPLVTSSSVWPNQSTPAFCWYNNDEAANKETFGSLYNWYALNTGKLCPAGWHVASDNEWKILEMYLGMSQGDADAIGWRGADQGIKLKNANGWNTGDNGINTSGFSSLPGGIRDANGNFDAIGRAGVWWSSTESGFTNAWFRTMHHQYVGVYRNDDHNKADGFSIRCLKD